MIWILFLLNGFFLYINYIHSKGNLFNPGVLFTFAFTFFSLFCCIANIFIGIDLDNVETIIIILFADFAFTICSWPLNREPVIATETSPLKIPTIYVLISILIVCITIYLRYQYIMEFGASYGSSGSFFDAMVVYKVVMTFDDPDLILVEPNRYLNAVGIFTNALSYIFMVVYFREKALFKKNKWGCLFIIGLYIINTVMTGGRSETFRYFTAMIFCWYFFTILKRGRAYNRYLLKKIFFIGILIAAFMVSFVYIIGRNDNDVVFEDVIRSLFVYAGAPIFNLDIYLSNPWFSNKGIFGELTFLKLINWIGLKFDIRNYIYATDLPFMSYSGMSLGNVYTTFYSFYYDFEESGVLFLTMIMALICVLVYKVAYRKIIPNKLYFGIVFYAFMINDIIMLPFASRVFDTLQDPGHWYVAAAAIIIIRFFNYVNVEHCKKL